MEKGWQIPKAWKLYSLIASGSNSKRIRQSRKEILDYMWDPKW